MPIRYGLKEPDLIDLAGYFRVNPLASETSDTNSDAIADTKNLVGQICSRLQDKTFFLIIPHHGDGNFLRRS